MKFTRHLLLPLVAALLLAAPHGVLARASFSKPPGSSVMIVDGASYGYPGTKASYIYFEGGPYNTVYGVVAQTRIPANWARDFRAYGRNLERSFKTQYANAKVTVRGNSYTIKFSANGLSYYARGILKGRTVYVAAAYAQSAGAKKNAMWKMIKNFKVK